MKRFFTLLLAASCLTAVGQSEYCLDGTVWDDALQGCIVANPSDSNFDGCVQLADLLDLLGVYGTCGDCGEGCSLANASSTCVDGECIIESCNDGFVDYNGEALDGCESVEVLPWSCGDDVDFEGYTYSTVQINGQCWFAENLRNMSYANGDAIAGSLNDGAWSTTSSGGRATFGEGASVCYGPAPGGDACNEAFSLASYGRLYNWHAVNDARGLCPSGWHVPSDGEWTTLTDGIGGTLTAGNTLKAGSSGSTMAMELSQWVRRVSWRPKNERRQLPRRRHRCLFLDIHGAVFRAGLVPIDGVEPARGRSQPG